MINKAIQKSQKPLVLILSMAGAIIGLSLLMTVTQVLTNLSLVKNGESGAIDEQYLVLSKEISSASTISGFMNSSSDEALFTEEEIDDLISQPFVKDYAPFSSGRNFSVMAKVKLGNGSQGSTLGFIASLPDRFIDVDPDDWQWKEGDDYIPLIMSISFLDMYNHGLSVSMNQPKVSKDIAGSIPIEVTISGNGMKETYMAKIVAFSDRINSALVPHSFLNFANGKFGSGVEQLPSQVMIATKNNKDPKIGQYLKDHGLEANKEQLRGTIIEKLIMPTLFFSAVLCVIIIVMTILIFMLYGEILIIKSKYDIHVLSLLGFKWKVISAVFNKFFFKIYGFIAGISLIIFFIAKIFLDQIIVNSLAFENLPIISWQTILAMMAFLGMFIVINIFNTRKYIKRIAKGKI
ncbi:MAG: hypothetical protein H6600_06030 [Flavobacteriales bacterium]|nr:hypothetical protein [Flavobacteriales bacterium]MCB9198001.1 hypothetical protein [Flavobacteriales bacterium]